ncbi:hypothetical protein ABEB36_009345 [Hypothenemus hampei]|uniref:DUF4817 domain-containing protein n=1 Tax=Hypothenemus hampei TaxID=57062 RepID=A0ABD1EGA6_HYPHA
MVLVYGEAGRHLDNAVNLYAQRFPERPRSRTSFYRVIQKFRNEGTVNQKKRIRPATVCGENNQIAVLGTVAINPQVSPREISRLSGISHMSVWRMLKNHKFHPYHISLHQ